MSIDVDRVYERLAQRADGASLPGLDAIRARVRQRRRNRTVATAAFVAAGVVAAFVPWLAGGSAPPTVRPDVPPPVTFIPFDPSAKPAIAFDRAPGSVISVTDDTRAYATWTDGDNMGHYAVIDLATGRPMFAPVKVGKLGDVNGMDATRDAILLETNSDPQKIPDTIIALDPDTGRELWRSKMDQNDRVLFSDTLVLTWHGKGRTDAIDLKTGAVRWSLHEPVLPGGTIAVRSREELYSMRRPGLWPVRDQRLVVRTEEKFKVLDVGTGRVLAERDAPRSAGVTEDLVVDDRVYLLSGRREVHEVDLTGTAPPRLVHTHATESIMSAVPCMDRLICLFGDGVTAVDPVTAKVVWHHPSAQPLTIGQPTLVGLTVPTGEGTIFLDPSGKVGFERELRGAAGAWWIDAGNLLMLRASGFAGFSVSTGKITELSGSTPIGVASWNRQMIVYATDTGIYIWRYVK